MKLSDETVQGWSTPSQRLSNFLSGALQFLPLMVTPVMETGLANDVGALEKFVGLLQTIK
jgi:hypothetical protein